MDSRIKEALEEVFESIEEALEKTKIVAEANDKIVEILAPIETPLQMSVLTLVTSKVIMEDCETLQEAMNYAGRFFHTLVETFDRNIDDSEEEGSEDSGTLQ